MMPCDCFKLLSLGAPCEPVHQTTQRIDKAQLFVEKILSKFQSKYTPSRELAVDETMLKFHGRFMGNHTCQRNPLNGGQSASAWQTAAMATSSMFFSVVVEHSVEQAASSCCIPSQYLHPKLPSLHHFPVRAVLWLHQADLLDSFLWRQCCKVRCCYSLSVWLWVTDEAVQPVDECMY